MTNDIYHFPKYSLNTAMPLNPQKDKGGERKMFEIIKTKTGWASSYGVVTHKDVKVIMVRLEDFDNPPTTDDLINEVLKSGRHESRKNAKKVVRMVLKEVIPFLTQNVLGESKP